MSVETIHSDSETFDLVHSPDDDGWYLQRWSDDAVSQIFATRDDAVMAARAFVNEGSKCIQWNA